MPAALDTSCILKFPPCDANSTTCADKYFTLIVSPYEQFGHEVPVQDATLVLTCYE